MRSQKNNPKMKIKSETKHKKKVSQNISLWNDILNFSSNLYFFRLPIFLERIESFLRLAIFLKLSFFSNFILSRTCIFPQICIFSRTNQLSQTLIFLRFVFFVEVGSELGKEKRKSDNRETSHKF